MDDNKQEKNLNRFFLIELKRKLSTEEYKKVLSAAEKAQKEIQESFPEDIKQTIFFKTVVLDKRAINSQSSRLINAANSLSTVYDSTLSLKLIEANKELAVELAEDKQKIKEAVSKIGSILSRRFKLRSDFYKKKNK